MLPLTKQERLVIAFVSAVLLAGMGLRYLCRHFAFFNNFVNLVAEEKLHPRVDINRAGQKELDNLPFVGEKAAIAILEHRRKNGFFKNVDDVHLVKGLRADTFAKIKKYLIARPVRKDELSNGVK